eukprot:2736983-Lingulodinium_polyedra.AAC.1
MKRANCEMCNAARTERMPECIPLQLSHASCLDMRSDMPSIAARAAHLATRALHASTTIVVDA